MGPLPEDRLEANGWPFKNTGLDYFGPLMVMVCRRGQVYKLRSDNGKNFVGADREARRFGDVLRILEDTTVELGLKDTLDDWSLTKSRWKATGYVTCFISERQPE